VIILVDINATAIPLIEPIGTIVNTVKVFVGGMFGIYIISVYLRWREYYMMKRILTEIKQNLREIADKQGVTLSESKKTFVHKLKDKLHQKPEEL
jgi:uncharacterized membrane protein YgaE (UPF0421/DUF939 family)